MLSQRNQYAEYSYLICGAYSGKIVTECCFEVEKSDFSLLWYFPCNWEQSFTKAHQNLTSSIWLPEKDTDSSTKSPDTFSIQKSRKIFM